MTEIQAPTPLLWKIWPPVHRHKFAVLVVDGYAEEWPRDLDQTVVAVCSCGARMTKEEIEQVLDGSN